MKWLLLLFVIGVVFLLFYIVTHKVKIKIKTFFKRGFAPKRGNFGLYVYNGPQGRGKTYSIVEYIIDHKDSCVYYSNITGIKNVDINYYVGFKGLLDLKEKLDSDTLEYDKKKQLVFIYDEIFTELMRGDKLSKPIMDFLCQMRKRKIIFLTTAQYWAEIPITFRRFCRYQIDCKMINIFGLGILIKKFKDAENIKWSNDDQDFVAPLLETTISHCRRYVANSYDTFLRISSVGGSLSKGSPDEKKDAIDFINGSLNFTILDTVNCKETER